MNNIVLTDEQFKELLNAVRPGAIANTMPELNEDQGIRATSSLAIDILQTCNRNSWYGVNELEAHKKLREAVSTLAKEYL